jgi:hypothetical protein
MWVVVAVLAAGLLVAAAAGDQPDVQYGVSVAKGCEPAPIFVGQMTQCFYVFTNFTSVGVGRVASQDTVTVLGADDEILIGNTQTAKTSYSATHGGADMLPALELLFDPAPGNPGAPSCTGGAGDGTFASPYVGATSCNVPYLSSIRSEDLGWYTVAPEDFAAGGSLNDRVTFSWKDQCDQTPTPDTCNKDQLNKNQAPASTPIRQYVPTVTTALSPTTADVGDPVTDQATITFDITPPSPPGFTGTVTYKVFSDSTCGTLVGSDVHPWSGGPVPPSKVFTFATPGTYAFQAVFSGDAAHGVAGGSSGCADEPLAIKAKPSITTVSTPDEQRVNATTFDTATLTGATATAGGTITFRLYNITATITCSAANRIATLVVAVSGPGSYQSNAHPNEGTVNVGNAGQYAWTAQYSGDPLNDSIPETSCNDPHEHSILDQAGTGISTTAAKPVPAGGLPVKLTDTATLQSSATIVTGTIEFHLFSDIGCKLEVPGSPPALVTVNGAGNYTSPPVTVNAQGTYYWQARYSGDANNAPAPVTGFTPCGDATETVTVPPANTSLTTSASQSAVTPAKLTDTAHFTTSNNNTTPPNSPGGTITFHLFSDSTCSTEVAGSPVSVPVTSGSGDYTSPPVTVNATGSYYWRVSYSGDANDAAVPLTPCGANGEISSVGPQGQIELCKDQGGGAAGVTFNFTAVNLTTGQSIPLTAIGGTCSMAVSVSPGRWQITEDLSSGLWQMVGSSVQPTFNLIGSSLSGGWVKVKVVAKAETQVTFVDQQAGATLKICKWSATPQFQGSQYSFTIGAAGTTVTAVAGSSAKTAGCSTAVSVMPGSIIKVTEATPPNEFVKSVSVSPQASFTQGFKLNVVKVTVGPGANVVTFENEPSPPA